ncbi:MAG: glutamate-1-semialdehyde 2,1-aminomutase [Desulfovibrionaceae bacterium]|nr:glutamate-1-semialdehyde 2,1-aminomutase [Desulfovibrionaceae bacterium]
MTIRRSQELFTRAQAFMPGGVNSPVRACRNVHSDPLFIASGQGSRLTTADGETLIDFVGSWGPMILGHAHPEVTRAVQQAASRGSSYGAPCEDEVRLAEEVCAALPSVDMVRMVNSGTEATMSALRLARAVTGRDMLIKFIGGYHGHGDAFLASAGSGVATFSIPGTPGVPASTVRDTLLAPYNDLDAVRALFEAHPGEIAALFVEPVAGNMGLMLPEPGFLRGLRDLCTAHGALLVFDEVITGFRLSYAGAQGRFGITPDLTTFGKIIGGGLPVGAYGGKAAFMERIAPRGDVYQAGTLSGNPLAMAAGLATLRILKSADYDDLERRVDAFVRELEAILRGKGVPVQIPHIASMFTVYFTDRPLRGFADVQSADISLFENFYKQMRDQGVFLAPSAFEANMVSFAHEEADFAAALRAARAVRF